MKHATYKVSGRETGAANVRKQHRIQIRPDGSKRQRVSRRGAGRTECAHWRRLYLKSATRGNACKGTTPVSAPFEGPITMTWK